MPYNASGMSELSHGGTPAHNQSTSDVPVPQHQVRAVSQPRAALLGREAKRSLLVFLVAALALLAADIALLRWHSGDYRVAVGNYRDEFFLLNANNQEVAPDGKTYRWTRATSELLLGELGASEHALLSLELGGRPTPAATQLTINDQPWLDLTAGTQPRVLHLLLPPGNRQERVIGITSPTFTVEGDPRQLGVKVEGFAVTLPRSRLPLPTPLHYLSQLGLLLAAQLTAIRLRVGWRGQALLLALLVPALAGLLSVSLLMAYSYLPALAIAAGVLAVLTWVALPQVERLADLAGAPYGGRRDLRIFWAIMLLACAIRLVGLLYPTFDGQDLGRNIRRQFMTLSGQMYIISGSAEFARGQTIYPTGPYLFLMPGILFTNDVGRLIETVLTILEGSTTLLIALLTRRLGGNRRAAIFAALLFLGSYASFSIHVYQFSAQIFGQWFTTLIALVLLADGGVPRFRSWALAILLLMFGVFSHIGVAILGISWMGLMLLLSLRRPTRDVWKAIGLFAAAGFAALIFMYLDIAAMTLTHTGTVVAQQTGGAVLPGATPGLLKGLRLAYSDIGVVLAPLGLLLVILARPRLDQLIVPLGMLLTVVFYLFVDLTLRLQVRYFYFALPFALALIGYILGRFALRGRAARVTAWLLVATLVFQGVALWFLTAFGDGQISMTPLTH